MKLELHHIDLSSTDVPAMNASRVTNQGYAGDVAFCTDGRTQVHLAERLGAWAISGWEQIFFHDPEGNIIGVHQVRA